MSSEGFSFEGAADSSAEMDAAPMANEGGITVEPELVDNPIAWEVQCGKCGQWGHDSGECPN